MPSPRSSTLSAHVTMTRSLQPLFNEISRALNEQELRSHVVPKIGQHFAAERWGVFFFDQWPLISRKFPKQLQASLSIERNPVARFLVERHAPVHESLVTSPRIWTMICPRPDHWHVMAGPIIQGSQLVGAVGCTRTKAMPAFDAQDLADMSAICLHLSVWAATVKTPQQHLQGNEQQMSQAKRLTPRELQIVELVASGRTNAEIGTELWITENSVKQALKRMFRKLGVSSRTEMVAKLAAARVI